MKKIIKSLLLLIILVVVGNMQTVSVQASEKSDIKKAVEAKLSDTDKVKKIFYFDFDHNGQKEAFLLTGQPDKDENDESMYILWFAYKKNGVVNTKKISETTMINSHVLKLESVTFMCGRRYATTSFPEDMYQVKGNEVKKVFEGDSIGKIGKNAFSSTCSAYDGALDDEGRWSCHTWNDYYFYYKNGKIYEYKAKQIAASKFKNQYSNASEMLKKYKKKGNQIGILVRTNGKVHINYQKYDTDLKMTWFTNVTFTVKGKKLTKAIEGSGRYKDKLK